MNVDSKMQHILKPKVIKDEEKREILFVTQKLKETQTWMDKRNAEKSEISS